MFTVKNILIAFIVTIVVLSLTETYTRLNIPESNLRPSIALTNLLQFLLPWAEYLGTKLAIFTDVASFLKDFLYDFYIVMASIVKVFVEPIYTFLASYVSYFYKIYSEHTRWFAIALSCGIIFTVAFSFFCMYYFKIRGYMGYTLNQ